jgi:dihydrofolate synthase/folylpolyglutamate synthase
MTYQQVVDFLMSQLPMYQRVGVMAFKKDLTNTRLLCEHLDNPQNKFKSIHIAGTNGKGSSAHSIAAILQSAGVKTGLYTSPHLKSFTERIKVDNHEIGESDVVEFVEKNKDKIKEIKPSFFEMTVVMAFDYFARQQVDMAVVEVGLGGRLDSTNIIVPEVSLITNISYDHTDLLGMSLEDIAFEKAGIIKEGRPVVVGEIQPGIDMVFKNTARRKGSPIFFPENEYSAKEEKDKITVSKKGSKKKILEFRPSLKGAYQAKNIMGILGVVNCLKDQGFEISDEQIIQGLEHTSELTGLKGRWQVLQEKPKVICDGAHNAAGIAQVLSQLEKLPAEKRAMIIGFTREKDVLSLLSNFPKEAYYYFVQASVPRAMEARELLTIAHSAGLKGEVEPDVNMALKLALSRAGENDLIFVGGSLFVLADLHNI